MNKELLISIKPEHLVNILNGKKTLELRKTVPKDYKGWVNIYCTKSSGGRTDMKRPYLFRSSHDNEFLKDCGADIYLISNLKPIRNILNGKVVARFWLDEYEGYGYGDVGYPEFYEDYKGNIIDTTKDIKGYYVFNDDLKKLCLSYEEFEEYGKEKNLYAWHIKKLEIFDKSKELSEFSVERPPQSYQLVYVKE